MKTSKILTLGLSFLMVGALASCGASEDDKAAVETALEKSICSVYSSGDPLLADVSTQLKGDDNDALLVTVSQIVNTNSGKKVTVQLDWTWEEKYNEYMSIVDLTDDPTHKKIEFTYPNKAKILADMVAAGEKVDSTTVVPNTPVEFKVTASLKGYSKEANYKAELVPETATFDPMTIEELYRANEAGTNFEFFDEATGKIKTNHGQNFYYIAVSGKLIYKAPDSNWGLLADGDHIAQLYRLDQCSDNDKAVVGNYITVYGEIGNGYGNVQISYISKIKVLTDHSSVTEPTMNYASVTAGMLTKGDPNFKSFCSGVSNSLYQITGTVKAGTDLATFTGGSRQTFVVVIDGVEMTIAYDYHVAKNNTELTNAFKNAISPLKGGDTVTIKGTLRWSNANGAHEFSDNGAWTITPFEASGIIKA